MQSASAGKTPALRFLQETFMSCALRVNPATQVKVSFHLLRRGKFKLYEGIQLRTFDRIIITTYSATLLLLE